MDPKATTCKFNEDDSGSLSEYTDPENNSAPTELLAEFLTSIMKKDWKNALKHCKLILEFEPNNKTAKDFYPQLLQRVNDQSSTSSDENYNCTATLDNVDNEILADDDFSSVNSSNTSSHGSMDLNLFSEDDLVQDYQEEENLVNLSISCESSDTFPQSMSSSESINHRRNSSPSLQSLLLDENINEDINNNINNEELQISIPSSSSEAENLPNSSSSPFTSKLVNMIRRKLK